MSRTLRRKEPSTKRRADRYGRKLGADRRSCCCIDCGNPSQHIGERARQDLRDDARAQPEWSPPA